MPVFGQTRAALAAAAARGADIVSSLRLVMTAEALTAPVPGLALELNTELEVLCDACRELAACRSGWLYLCPAGDVQPAALPRGLLHGHVLLGSGRGRLGLLRGRDLVGCYGRAANGAKEGVVDKRRATRATKHGGLLSVHSFHPEGKPKNAAFVAQHSAQTTAKGRSSQVPLC